jgi:hypothetical protein
VQGSDQGLVLQAADAVGAAHDLLTALFCDNVELLHVGKNPSRVEGHTKGLNAGVAVEVRGRARPIIAVRDRWVPHITLQQQILACLPSRSILILYCVLAVPDPCKPIIL